MSNDISRLLSEWEYDPDSNIRIIISDSKRSVLQVREPMGISQYELEGRPDGRKINSFTSYLDYLLDRERKDNENFSLSDHDIYSLESESRLFYYRYLLCFQMGDFARVVRDTDHNLEICRFVDDYCTEEMQKIEFLQYKPFIVKMNAISRAMISLQKNIRILARQILETAIVKLKKMPDLNTSIFMLEKTRAINYLEAALKQLDAAGPDKVLDSLLGELEAAVSAENYEKAAELRDKIRELSKKSE